MIKATNRINGQAHGIWLDILETDKLWFPAKFVVGFVVKSKIASNVYISLEFLILIKMQQIIQMKRNDEEKRREKKKLQRKKEKFFFIVNIIST